MGKISVMAEQMKDFRRIKTMEGSGREKISLGLERLGYSRDPSGRFRIPVPFRKLEKEELHQIFYDGCKFSTCPKRRFDDLMEEMGRAELKAVKERLSEMGIRADETGELEAVVEVQVPVGAHLRQTYHGDIGVDTGDAGWDYTLNTLMPNDLGFSYGVGYRLFNDASIVWLTKQQGYTKKDLAYGLHLKEYHIPDMEKGYLKSVVYEVWHELSSQNQLFFLVEMPLEEMMLIAAAAEWGESSRKWSGYVVLDKETCTGFFDTWLGSGSLMGIELEKDVKLPIKHIAYAIPDEVCYIYNVYSVYRDDTMWQKGRLKKITLPKKFRLQMADFGFEPRIKNMASLYG